MPAPVFRLLLLLLCLVGCSPDERAAPGPASGPEPAAAPPDRSGVTDGGAPALPESLRTRLVREDGQWAEALRIHYNALVVDGHVDTPMMMADQGYRIAERHAPQRARAHLDLPRMAEGGLDAVFFSIYVDPRNGEGAAAVARAKRMIAEVRRQVEGSEDAAIARTAEEVRRLAKSGRRAILLGIEGGHALAASPETLRTFRDLGVRYVGLTHVNTNAWADASQSPPRWNGLNDLGRRMVAEMNRLGILVDVSHVSDSTFYDVLAVTRAPVIASHSSARALVGNVRNLSDDMLHALARNGGVAMINFYDLVVDRRLTSEVMADAHRRLERDYGGDYRMLWQALFAARRARNLPGGTLEDVVAHVDHVARLVGVDHVALGSDFDGVDALPRGLEDVSRLPWITYELLRRGYSEDDLYKILGGNTLRVLEEAERVAE